MTTVMIYDLAVKKLTYQYFTSLLNIYVYICVYVCVCVCIHMTFLWTLILLMYFPHFLQ